MRTWNRSSDEDPFVEDAGERTTARAPSSAAPRAGRIGNFEWSRRDSDEARNDDGAAAAKQLAPVTSIAPRKRLRQVDAETERLVSSSASSVTQAGDHLARHSAADRAFIIEEPRGQRALDPGLRTLQEIQAMSADDVCSNQHQRAQWHASMPFVYTAQAEPAMQALTVSALAASGSPRHQRGVPVVSGPPGVGKSLIVRQFAVNELRRLARLDHLLGHTPDPDEASTSPNAPCSTSSLRTARRCAACTSHPPRAWLAGRAP